MVTGPRIDPRELPDAEGLEKHPYIHNLFEHLACADAAVVQGGLSTSMELVATHRPFMYVPLRRHWEQQNYVAHRLMHYGARAPLDFSEATPGRLAETLSRAIDQPARLPGDQTRCGPAGGGADRRPAAAALNSTEGPPGGRMCRGRIFAVPVRYGSRRTTRRVCPARQRSALRSGP